MIKKIYILKDLDNHSSLSYEGDPSSKPHEYDTLNEASAAKDKIGNCYIDLQRKEEQVNYPITVFRYFDYGEEQFYAYLPDFGHAACSFVGDTLQESLEGLAQVEKDVKEHFKESGKELPDPSSKVYSDMEELETFCQFSGVSRQHSKLHSRH